MFKRILGKFSKDLGIDLGTSNTLVYVRDKGIVINEPSVVAVNARTSQIIAIGRDAQEMLGKTPTHISISKPLLKGIISDFEITEKMLRYFIEKVHENSFTIIPRPRVVVGIPLEITEVEKKAVEDAMMLAGAREVALVEEPLAAAIGARLPVEESVGSMIVNIGGGTTQIAVISLAGVVTWKSLPIAGDELTKNIIQFARDQHNLLLGERIAELIKMRIGSAEELEVPLEMEMRGRDLLSGLPAEVIVNDEEIRRALERSIKLIVENIKAALEVTPPELTADIYERGMVLTGGGALLKGLDKLIARATEVPVRIADDPLTCLVRGTGILLENKKLLKEVQVPSGQTR
ncbi:MAG: rod shape-determining protein [Patescibacteria group bacterium]